MDRGTDERRLLIEIIVTLVYQKHGMVTRVLLPVGVRPELCAPLFDKDQLTGKRPTKREFAAPFLDAVNALSDGPEIKRRILEAAAGFEDFHHLADDEYLARATVQKAREHLNVIRTYEDREAKQAELARAAEVARLVSERERERMITREMGLLLSMYDGMFNVQDAQARGLQFEQFLNRLFDAAETPVVSAFRRNALAEQIDGAFRLDGWHYLVECRWWRSRVSEADLASLTTKLGRSSPQTMGLLVAVNGWTANVVPLLKQNPVKNPLLADGYDLRQVLAVPVGLAEVIRSKAAGLSLYAEPFVSVAEYLAAPARFPAVSGQVAV